uniref:F-box domain-containing protein n=1 Tax=Leersia perrieri TaxID=77586 RepID=A0A0D9W5X9_9ORYZ
MELGIRPTQAATVKAEEASDAPPCKRARLDADAGGGGGGGGGGAEVVKEGEEDRLSDLPDCLLEDILGHLGSRQAVQTSALSRRWRHVWRRGGGSGGGAGVFDAEVFEDFADNILSPGLLPSAAPELDAFRMSLDEAVCTNFQRWIRRALWRRPASVDIRYSPNFGMSWPPTVTLAPPAAAARIRALRIYGLRPTVVFGADEFPSLEDLHIERCGYAHRTINLPALKRLTIVSPLNGSFCTEQDLTAPGLTSMRLVLPYTRDHGVKVLIDAPLASLVDASISLVDTATVDHRRPNLFQIQYFTAMSDLLGRITSVRNLELTGFTATALLDNKSQEFPLFPYLTTLLLNECDIGTNYHVLKSILQNAPSLEQLKLHNCKFVGKRKRMIGITKLKEKAPPSFACSSLKSVEIKHPRNEIRSCCFIVEFEKEMLLNQWRKRSTCNDEISQIEFLRRELRKA